MVVLVGFVAWLIEVVAAAVVVVLVGFVACLAVVAAASVVMLWLTDNSGHDAEARPGRGYRSHIRCI